MDNLQGQNAALINPSFFESIDVSNPDKICKNISKRLTTDYNASNLNCLPVNFENMDYILVAKYVTWYNLKSQSKMGKDALRVFLAAVKDLFRTYHVKVDEAYWFCSFRFWNSLY